MTRLRIKTETETLHDEQVSDENLAERKQAYSLQVELYNMQGIECKLVEGEDVEPDEEDEE
jgi:hypothetical protein